jgi:hypothetical protein
VPKILIELPLIRACIEKWEAGRALHGDEFEGNPLAELFEELVDGIHYAEQAELEGLNMAAVRDKLIAIALEVQGIYAHGDTPAGLTAELSLQQEVLR